MTEQKPQITDEQKKMMEEMLAKVKKIQEDAEKFSKKIITKLKDDLLGISLMPPEKKGQKDINLLILLDDQKVEPQNKGKFVHDNTKICEELCKDSTYTPNIMLFTELKQALYDDNVEATTKVTKALPLYQKNNVLNAFVLPEVHKNLVLEKFEKYVVSYVGVGSIMRGEGNPKSDIDVFIIIDDTDVKRMSRAELKDKLSSLIYSMSFQAQEITKIKIPLHIQTYLLTDFWEMLKESSSPVIHTFLRDGLPFFDRGIYRPWRLLIEMGRIKPSREAIVKHMEAGDLFYERAKKKLLSVVVEDLYYSVLNPAQSLLMLKGIAPPTHKETIQLFREIIVGEEKLATSVDADILEEFVMLFKKWEYNEITEITGSEIEKFMEKADKFRKKVFPIIDELNYKIYKTKLSKELSTRKPTAKKPEAKTEKKSAKKKTSKKK
ncbi:nucleotidyltransferase domain-containing protein [Candidatus Woesearchaeota archaeon]|nr:nucleotidyltransferase domain-containing protein [Candidatus Woesearchaeota archaeon]